MFKSKGGGSGMHGTVEGVCACMALTEGAKQVRGSETKVFMILEACSSPVYSPKLVSSVPDCTV